MKKIVTLLLFLLFAGGSSFAATPVNFLYINGSNNNNEKAYNWFVKGINKLHPALKAQIEKDEFVSKYMLDDGTYKIEEKPSLYFWGYKSQQSLVHMQQSAKLLQSVSPWMAYLVRNVISDIMHDAIWVTKTENMVPIVNEVNEQVKENYKQGKKTVLFGYSAGTFITFEYFLQKMPYINVGNWVISKTNDNEVKKFIKANPRKNTCANALVASKVVSADALGKIQLNLDKKAIRQAYLNLDKYTDMYCSPKDAVLGVVNYASPIPLFYSDITSDNMDKIIFLRRMYQYVIENDIFFLTVNFSDDPLGFPNDVNYKNADIEKMLNTKLNNPQGFTYDYSKVMSLRTVAAAHTSYWNANKRFAKAICAGYKEGYNFQYCETNTEEK